MRDGEITLTQQDQTRLHVLMDLQADRMTTAEAASALHLTTRQIRTLRRRLEREDAAGIIHRNRGRRPLNACETSLAERVVELWKERYPGFNQVFFTEMLEREEGILLSRSTVRRMLAAKGIGAAKPQKRSRHRRHRVRRAQAGAMVQMDGSDHDWLEDRGPGLTLVGGIDDATSRVWATFRLQEDTRGYFEVLRQIALDEGVPLSLYLDGTTIALGTRRTSERVRTGNVHFPTHMTRVLDRLDIVLIQARSPQAKGRIERLWRTFQDRLLCELRAKKVHTFAHAQQVLKDHLSFHNRNFEIDPIDPNPAWRPISPTSINDEICWSYKRTVTNVNTVSVEGTKLQLEFPAAHPGWAKRRIEIRLRLDGTWFAKSFQESCPATPINTQTTKTEVAA